ncbi:MAG TPA: SAM-dependent methyltransferase [Syntrophomonas sp.]|jgi:trans-aconitate methyltransferase|nr:SAM-dependent methyltransferase [Syntrophomonas sp.]
MVKEWNPDLYDEKHAFVSKLGEDLIELLQPQSGELILDLGCGTGDLSHLIKQSGATVEGLDASKEMVARAREKYPDIQFRPGDACSLNIYERYDAVFSNAVLHWIKEPEKALAGIWQALKKKGRFVAEFGGRGNVNNVTRAVMKCLREMGHPVSDADLPWYYPSIGEYTSLMEEHGFCVTYARYFVRPTILEDGENGLSNWLDMFADLLFKNYTADQKQMIFGQIKDQLRDSTLQDGQWIVDYKRIRVVGIKEE